MPDTPSQGLVLSEEITTAVNNALADGKPILMAYVADDGQPHLSFRGSVHVHSPESLAVWARNPEGGLPNAVGRNPRVTLMYRDAQSRTSYTFYGRATVTTDEATRRRVYDESAEPERNADPDRKGIAIVVDLDRVDGFKPPDRFTMRRA